MICCSHSVYLRNYACRQREMNAGLWEQRLGWDFQTNVTFHLLQQVWKLRNVLPSHYFCTCRIITESLMMTSVITLYHAYRINDHPHVPMSLVSLSCGDYLPSWSSQKMSPGGLCVSSQFCKKLPLTVTALFLSHKVLPVTSLLFLVLCCYCRQHEIDKGWNREELKQYTCSFDASDTSIYKRENCFYTTQHTCRIEGEWLFRSSLQCNST